MPFIPTKASPARAIGTANDLPNYYPDSAATFEHNQQRQVRIGRGVIQGPLAGYSNLMGEDMGLGEKNDSRACGVEQAELGVSITTAAAKHLASKRWGST